VINPLNVNIICVLAGELLLGAEDHHAVRPAAVQGGGRQAEVHLQADGQGQKGGESLFYIFLSSVRPRLFCFILHIFVVSNNVFETVASLSLAYFLSKLG
jgi:hypothetical protein